MKFLIVLASVVLAISAATDKELWLEFKETHAREYRNIREEQLRFTIFQQNLRAIEEHNAKYESEEETYYLGVTQFADMSQEEFLSMLNYSQATKPTLEEKVIFDADSVAATPSEINWVTKGVVVGVKNQGSCGSCWAFSAAAALESAYAIKHGSLTSLSEQNLMDCSTAYGNEACNGGLMEYAYKYVRDYGIESEKDYPYTARKGTCHYSASLRRATVKSYATVAYKSESSLQAAVGTVGPVSVAVNANLWQLYGGGVFDDSSCSQSMNHGVLAVGYGTQGSIPYWLIKNSWGTSWGEKGYIKLVRNKSNQCGIANDATIPTMN